MSTETTLKALINPLVAGGCHNGVNASPTIVAPYVVFHEISGIPLNTLDGYAGKTRCRYQIDVFARSPEQAKGLALLSIRPVIEDSPELKGLLLMQMKGQYSELDKTHQYITDYSIWQTDSGSSFTMTFPLTLG